MIKSAPALILSAVVLCVVFTVLNLKMLKNMVFLVNIYRFTIYVICFFIVVFMSPAFQRYFVVYSMFA